MISVASIMIVTYNRLELTKQTLDNLFQNTDYPFNIIIIDNDSKDGTIEYLYEFLAARLAENGYLKGFKIQRNETNVGIAVGRNQALLLTESTDSWLSTLDNDVLVPKGWLTEAIDIITKNPKFGMIGVNMENVNYPIVNLNGKEFQVKPQGNLGTACTVFNKSFHKMLGFFNTSYGKYGLEDSDFGFRARVIGYQLGYIKENGKHLGEGENDIGEYREFKTDSHQKYLEKFKENCRLYYNRLKPLYFPFKQ